VFQASQEQQGMQNVQQFERFLTVLLCVILLVYRIICTHTHKTVEWRDNKTCYVMVLSRRTEKHFFKEGNRHAMFLMTSVSTYGHVLKKIIFRKNF